jgi:hypothetical protein
MEAVEAVDVLEKDAFINSWRLAPSAAQLRYATGLCQTELPYAERVRTIALFASMDNRAISELIDELAGVRARRMKRLRRLKRRR